jgi:hypothetical protein
VPVSALASSLLLSSHLSLVCAIQSWWCGVSGVCQNNVCTGVWELRKLFAPFNRKRVFARNASALPSPSLSRRENCSLYDGLHQIETCNEKRLSKTPTITFYRHQCATEVNDESNTYCVLLWPGFNKCCLCTSLAAGDASLYFMARPHWTLEHAIIRDFLHEYTENLHHHCHHPHYSEY